MYLNIHIENVLDSSGSFIEFFYLYLDAFLVVWVMQSRC
jgi:hypothetical protein